MTVFSSVWMKECLIVNKKQKIPRHVNASFEGKKNLVHPLVSLNKSESQDSLIHSLIFSPFWLVKGIYIRPIKPPYISPSGKCLLSLSWSSTSLLPKLLSVRISRAAFLDKKTWFYIFCISALFKKRHDRYKDRMQKLEPAGKTCAPGQQASMISY